jgi:hypothetical protein
MAMDATLRRSFLASRVDAPSLVTTSTSLATDDVGAGLGRSRENCYLAFSVLHLIAADLARAQPVLDRCLKRAAASR